MTESAPHYYTALAGTHGWRGAETTNWACADSPFWRMMARHDLVMLNPDRPFKWSTDLNGYRFWRRWFGLKDWPSDWYAGAQALTYYYWPVTDPLGTHIPIAHRTTIVHSHGLQPTLIACGEYGLKIPRLLSVCSPWHRDMEKIAEKARPNIGQWLYVHTSRDRWQRRGDGRIALSTKQCPLADWSDRIEGIGHSGLLNDPRHFYLWREMGYLDFLKGRW